MMQFHNDVFNGKKYASTIKNYETILWLRNKFHISQT